MPRATLKPFTIYEDLVGFQGARRNAYLIFGGFSVLFVVKLILAMNFSMYSTVTPLLNEAEDERYQEGMLARRDLAEQMLYREKLRRAAKQPPIA
jgi:hypothetical protein